MIGRRRERRDADVAGAVVEGIVEVLLELGWLSIPDDIDLDMAGDVVGLAAVRAVRALDGDDV